jgi:hypothetical protein
MAKASRSQPVTRPRAVRTSGRRSTLSPPPSEHGGIDICTRHATTDIHSLDRLSRSELRALWTQELGERPPATLGRDVLALAIAYARQERRQGGLNKLVAPPAEDSAGIVTPLRTFPAASKDRVVAEEDQRR